MNNKLARLTAPIAFVALLAVSATAKAETEIERLTTKSFSDVAELALIVKKVDATGIYYCACGRIPKPDVAPPRPPQPMNPTQFKLALAALAYMNDKLLKNEVPVMIFVPDSTPIVATKYPITGY